MKIVIEWTVRRLWTVISMKTELLNINLFELRTLILGDSAFATLLMSTNAYESNLNIDSGVANKFYSTGKFMNSKYVNNRY